MPAVIPEEPYPPDSNLQICVQDGIVIRYLRGPFDKKETLHHLDRFESAGHDLGDDWFGAQIISIKLGAFKELMIEVLQAFSVEIVRNCGHRFDLMSNIVIVVDDSSEENEVRKLVSEAFDNIRMWYTYQSSIETAKKWLTDKLKKRLRK